jgi:hypothetical protein
MNKRQKIKNEIKKRIIKTGVNMINKSIVFIFGFLIGMMILGCEKNKDMTLTIEKEYTMNYKTAVNWQGNSFVPALTNSDFDKNKFDIQSAELQSSSYIVTSLTPPAGKKADSIKVDSIGIKVGGIFGSDSTALITLKNIYLNSALTQQNISISGNTGKTTFENLIGKSPYSARVMLTYSNPKDSTLYSIKFNFMFKITYKEKLL